LKVFVVIFTALEELKEGIYSAMGYTSIMREISATSIPFKDFNDELKDSEIIEKLKYRLNHWKKN